MSKPRPAEAVKLAMSVFFSDEEVLKSVLDALSARYGDVDFISSPTLFNCTDYYAEEMGPDLIRRFFFFDELIRPESLPDIKLFTNGLEDRFSVNGKRRINIDPGYISQAHLILATGKGYTHRPYLRDGIYADLTLIYKGQSFHPLPWTYPDYADMGTIGMFNRVRAKYVVQLKLSRNV